VIHLAEAMQVYLLASGIVFGAQALVLTDSKFPVWYPYFGTWILGALVEIVLIVVPNAVRHPKTAFDFVVLFEQTWRTSTFIILLVLYFGLRNDTKQYENADEEGQSLLRNKLAPKPLNSEDSAAKDGGYGATMDSNAQESDTTGGASDAGSEDSYFEEQRKSRELIAKRLKQDGNWFTYAKGFTVDYDAVYVLFYANINRYSFHTYGHITTRLCNSAQF
jgi:hypothetical protein